VAVQGQLECVEKRLECREVPLEERLVVHDDMHLLPKDHRDVDRQGGDDHRLALAGAYLGDEGVGVGPRQPGLEEAPEDQQADDLGVVW